MLLRHALCRNPVRSARRRGLDLLAASPTAIAPSEKLRCSAGIAGKAVEVKEAEESSEYARRRGKERLGVVVPTEGL